MFTKETLFRKPQKKIKETWMFEIIVNIKDIQEVINYMQDTKQ